MNSCSNSAEILSPPETHRRIDWKSSRVAPWSRTRPNSGAGSMHSSDGRVLRSSGSSSSPPNDRAIATQAPAASPANDERRAAMCEADVAGRKTSAGVIPSPAIALATIQPNVSCVCVTPFGLPVLPDVKKINAGASAPAAAASRRRQLIRRHQLFQLAMRCRPWPQT